MTDTKFPSTQDHKLNWTLQYGHLVAEAEGCRFDVEQTGRGWQAAEQMFKKLQCNTYTSTLLSPRFPSLQEAMGWCDLQLKIWLAPAPKSPSPQETKETVSFMLPFMLGEFAATREARAAHSSLPCPKPGFTDWGRANAMFDLIAGQLSDVCKLDIRWNAEPNMEENILGELGKFEVRPQETEPPPNPNGGTSGGTHFGFRKKKTQDAQSPDTSTASSGPPSIHDPENIMGRATANLSAAARGVTLDTVDERLSDLEAKQEDTHANLKVVQAMTERLEDEANPYEIATRLLRLETAKPAERLTAIEAEMPRIAELEERIRIVQLVAERADNESDMYGLAGRVLGLEIKLPALDEEVEELSNAHDALAATSRTRADRDSERQAGEARTRSIQIAELQARLKKLEGR